MEEQGGVFVSLFLINFGVHTVGLRGRYGGTGR